MAVTVHNWCLFAYLRLQLVCSSYNLFAFLHWLIDRIVPYPFGFFLFVVCCCGCRRRWDTSTRSEGDMPGSGRNWTCVGHRWTRSQCQSLGLWQWKMFHGMFTHSINCSLYASPPILIESIFVSYFIFVSCLCVFISHSPWLVTMDKLTVSNLPTTMTTSFRRTRMALSNDGIWMPSPAAPHSMATWKVCAHWIFTRTASMWHRAAMTPPYGCGMCAKVIHALRNIVAILPMSIR